MPHPVTCGACTATFSIPDEVWDKRVHGQVATLKCRQCKAPIEVDGRVMRRGSAVNITTSAVATPSVVHPTPQAAATAAKPPAAEPQRDSSATDASKPIQTSQPEVKSAEAKPAQADAPTTIEKDNVLPNHGSSELVGLASSKRALLPTHWLVDSKQLNKENLAQLQVHAIFLRAELPTPSWRLRAKENCHGHRQARPNFRIERRRNEAPPGRLCHRMFH
jgi:hypothetical protein